jgi:CHC2 zinc finger
MNNNDLCEAKQLLPLPLLMQRLGLGDHAKVKAKCLWHDDAHPSFGILPRDGKWFFKCQAGCGHGDEIDFLAKYRGCSKGEAIREFLSMAGVSDSPASKAARKPDKPASEALPYTPSISTATVQPPSKPPKIAYERSILDRFREAIRSCGVVGEDTTAATLYLVITTRLLDKPVSAAVKGLSSSGKSFTTEKTVEFFPPDAVIVMTAMSERALVYSKEEYAHRTLILYEAAALREGAEDNLTAYFVRSLLSEGRIEYPVTVRDQKDGGFITKTIVKEGPTNLIITTTKTRVHAENETRLLSLNTNDTREQTKAIFRALASERRADVDKNEWCQFQKWLQNAEHRVSIPYAKHLADLVPPVAVRLRRDFGAVLALIKAHAILQQLSREQDTEGRIVATIEDYAEVRELVAPIVSEAVGSTVSDAVRETVDAVEAMSSESGVMALAIAERLKLDKGTISRRLRMAADQGFIRNLEDRRGKPGRWVTGDPLPGESNLLPPPSDLQQSSGAGCTVASDFKGIYTQQDRYSAPQAEPASIDLKEIANGKAREPKSAHGLLAYLVNAIKTAPGGVYPLGHEDCHWNAAAYPAQLMAASGYLMDGDPADEEAALHCLTALAHKIDCETLMGTPLICGGQEWLSGAYHLARAYIQREGY